MNIYFRSFFNHIISSCQEKVIEPLSHQQKRILIIASTAFAFLAACYAAIRHFDIKFIKDQHLEDSDLIDKKSVDEDENEVLPSCGICASPREDQHTDEISLEKSLSFLFLANSDPQRLNKILEAFESGFNLVHEDESVEPGAFSSWEDASTCWGRRIGMERPIVTGQSKTPIKDVIVCDDQLSYLIALAEDNPNIFSKNAHLNFDDSTGLLFQKSSTDQENAVCAQVFRVNLNHFVGVFFDPIKCKYILSDNMRYPHGHEIEINQPSFSMVQYLSDLGYKNVNLTKHLIEDNSSSFLIINKQYAHLLLKEKDWKGLNWEVPIWRDNNCYLSCAWLMTAYKYKIYNILRSS